MTIEHVDINDLSGETPQELLTAWTEATIGSAIGTVEMMQGLGRPDELAVIYYTADPDAASGTYGRHGVIGLQISPDDPGGALVFDRPAIGAPPIEGEPDEAHYQAALHAAQVVLMAAHRTCAPHHTVGGELATHNEMCTPDL